MIINKHILLSLQKKINMTDFKYNRIRVALAERDLSNKWLADRLEKTSMTVSRWVSNKSQPTVETLYEIASALDMEAKDLLAPVNDIDKKRISK